MPLKKLMFIIGLNTHQPKAKPKEKTAKGRISRRGGRGVGRGWGPCGRPWVGNCDVQAKQGATAGGHKGPPIRTNLRPTRPLAAPTVGRSWDASCACSSDNLTPSVAPSP